MPVDSAIWGLIGTVVGALSSIGTTWLANQNSHRLQRDRVRNERVEQSNALQRESLLAVQDAMHDAIRLVHRAHIEDVKAHRATKTWGKNMLPEDMSEEIRLAQRRVFILVERILDEDLRGRIKGLMGNATEVLMARSEEQSHACLEKTGSDSNKVLEQLGTVLRTHLKPCTAK